MVGIGNVSVFANEQSIEAALHQATVIRNQRPDALRPPVQRWHFDSHAFAFTFAQVGKPFELFSARAPTSGAYTIIPDTSTDRTRNSRAS
jgi:hypothetical protein